MSEHEAAEHDARCEAEYVHEAPGWTECGCAHRAAARPAGDDTAPPVAAECFVPTLDGLIASVIHHDEPMPVVRNRAAERCASIAQHEADRRAAAGPRPSGAGDDTAPPDLYRRAKQYARDLEAGVDPHVAWERARPAAGPRAGDTAAAVSVSEHGEGEHVSDHADHGNARAGDTVPDPQPVNADLRDRIRNYPGDGPHQAGAGDTAPDDDCVSPARIAAYELRQLTKCRCEFPVSAMGQHDRECASDNREYVDTLIAEVHRLRSEVAALRAAGNELAREVEERDTPYGPLAREVQAWRSAAGSPATAQPPADDTAPDGGDL